MKKIGLTVLLVSVLSACSGSSSSTSGTPQNPPNKPSVSKHIAIGENLIFTCADKFNRTTVSIVAAWDYTTSSWSIFVEEFDGAGNTIFKQDNLIGKPDSIQSWQMNISDSTGLFALISQSGSDQAIYKARGRNLDCRFN